ncbi:AI-2E family transporter, partial [Fulvimarina endophytica]
REDLRNRLIRLAGTDDLQQTTAAIDDAARRLGRLLLFQLAVNAAFGALVGIGLFFIGVPSPFLWGVLGGILRFVPYIGGFISAALPLALAFAVDPGWSMVIWTLVLFVGAELFLSNVAEPLLYGHSTGLSPVAILLAASVWAFLWGPVGLILATPLTVCLVVMGRYVPRLEFIDVIFGDRPALSPPQIFYQRMLAGEPGEASDQARAFLRERALATYYDEVALAGMRLAHEDVSRYAVEGERLEVMKQAVHRFVRSLDRLKSPLPKGGALNSEAAAAVAVAGPDAAVARIVKRKNELAPPWRGETPVVCIAGNGTLDEPVTTMLAQVVTKHGLRTRTLNWGEANDLNPGEGERQGVALVILSFLEPLSLVHLRLAVRKAHAMAPGARVILGIWRARDPRMVAELKSKLHADAVVTNFNEGLAAILSLAEDREPRSGHEAPSAIRHQP